MLHKDGGGDEIGIRLYAERGYRLKLRTFRQPGLLQYRIRRVPRLDLLVDREAHPGMRRKSDVATQTPASSSH